jgi:hypothetical protein
MRKGIAVEEASLTEHEDSPHPTRWHEGKKNAPQGTGENPLRRTRQAQTSGSGE